MIKDGLFECKNKYITNTLLYYDFHVIYYYIHSDHYPITSNLILLCNIKEINYDDIYYNSKIKLLYKYENDNEILKKISDEYYDTFNNYNIFNEIECILDNIKLANNTELTNIIKINLYYNRINNITNYILMVNKGIAIKHLKNNINNHQIQHIPDTLIENQNKLNQAIQNGNEIEIQYLNDHINQLKIKITTEQFGKLILKITNNYYDNTNHKRIFGKI